jgi:hypothetical protein
LHIVSPNPIVWPGIASTLVYETPVTLHAPTGPPPPVKFGIEPVIPAGIDPLKFAGSEPLKFAGSEPLKFAGSEPPRLAGIVEPPGNELFGGTLLLGPLVDCVACGTLELPPETGALVAG